MTTIDHERCSDLLGAFTRRKLSPRDADQVAEHLEQCDDCRAEYRALQALYESEPGPMTDSERQRLEGAVSSAISASPARGTRRLTGAWLGRVAAVAVVLVGAGYVLLTRGDEGVPFEGGGGGGGGIASNEKAATNLAAGTPVFRHAGALSRGELREKGRVSRSFVTAARAYNVADAELVQEQLLERLAENAPTRVQDQIRQCSHVVFSELPYAAVPAYGALGRIDRDHVIVLGYAWSQEATETSHLDHFMMWAWPIRSCDVPAAYESGPIKH
jgi:anti-sigma factor RsiW